MNQSQLLKKTAGETLNGIPAEDVRELVAKSRWTCDSNWMMAMVMNAGWDVANKMNLHAARQTAKVEMHRLMRLLNLDQPKNPEECMTLMKLAMETFVTSDYFDYEFKITADGTNVGIIKRCYAYTKVKSINVDKDYECGCFGLRAGWYDAMGIDVKEELMRCLKNGDDQCEIAVESVIFAHQTEKK